MALANNNQNTQWALCPTCNVDREVKEIWFPESDDPRYILGRCDHSFRYSQLDYIIERKKHG